MRQKDGNVAFANALLDKYFKPVAGDDWFFNGMGKDAIENVRKGYEEHYGNPDSAPTDMEPLTTRYVIARKKRSSVSISSTLKQRTLAPRLAAVIWL